MVRTQHFLSYLFLAAFAMGCTPSGFQTPSPDPNETQNIIGGTEWDASETLSLSVVAIYDAQEGQLCSGTLIDRNVVLTAAHCVGQDLQKMYVFFGQNLDENATYAPVDKIEISPYWNSTGQKNIGDVALLHFQGPLPSPHQPASLLPSSLGYAVQNEASVIVAGYGVSHIDTSAPPTLRKAQVRVSDAQFSNSEVLVDQSQGQGVCYGDSGGPAFIQVHGTYYLWGVTSRGINDPGRSCSTSAAFTSTVYHGAWILRMKDKLSSSLINFLWQD